MRQAFPVACLAAILGVLVGLALAFLWLRTTENPDHRAQILAKVAKDFVAERRKPGGGITFFDQPKPYGNWLCRTNAYFVPEKVITGKLVQKQDWWADNLGVTTLYGVWRKPSLGLASDAERHKACAGFGDFDHLFGVRDSADPERGAFLLDRILTLLRLGDLHVPLSCAHIDRNGRPSNCDASAILKTVTLRSLSGIEAVSEEKIDGGMRRTDRLTLAGDQDSEPAHSLVDLLVVSDQHFGKQSASEGDLRSVAVSLNCLC